MSHDYINDRRTARVLVNGHVEKETYSLFHYRKLIQIFIQIVVLILSDAWCKPRRGIIGECVNMKQLRSKELDELMATINLKKKKKIDHS